MVSRGGGWEGGWEKDFDRDGERVERDSGFLCGRRGQSGLRLQGEEKGARSREVDIKRRRQRSRLRQHQRTSENTFYWEHTK